MSVLIVLLLLIVVIDGAITIERHFFRKGELS